MIAVFIFIKCTDENRIANTEEKTFADFKQSLTTDPLFGKVLESAEKIGDFVNDPKTVIHTDVKLEILEERFRKASNKKSQMSVLSDLTNRPKEFYELIEKKYKYQKDFNAQNPGFTKLNKAEHKALITDIFSKKYPSLNASKSKEVSGAISGCAAARQISRDYCYANSLVESAACGWFTPTLWGAVLCGGVVVTKLSLCYGQADNAYNECVNGVE